MAISHAQNGQVGHTLTDWRPEDDGFWTEKGHAIATRNLWISIPNLLLAFSVWMVWSVVVAKMPAIGFNFSVGERFWLAALPGLSGATLRIFYSFMIPVFGGRLWTTLSTASLLLPASVLLPALLLLPFVLLPSLLLLPSVLLPALLPWRGLLPAADHF